MMDAMQPKKALILNILLILKKYSDENHRLTQKQIMDYLQMDYQMKVDRKSVRRNLTDLVELGYNIEFRESTRKNKDGKEESFYTDWYLEHDFTDAELRLLIDCLLFSKNIPYHQRKEIIRKMEGLSSKYFSEKMKYTCVLPESVEENKELFFTIEVLNEAIDKGQQVQFCYGYFDVDKKLHTRKNSDGKMRTYIVNPYQMVETNEHYYLICNNDKFDDMSNYRVDRIQKIKLLGTPIKPMYQVKGMENGLDLPRHMAEHIYMFDGESVRVVFRAERRMVGDIIDWFGSEIQFFDVTDDEVSVSVNVNEKAMRCWAMQYLEHITVLSPPSLIAEIQRELSVGVKKYKELELVDMK